MHIVLYQPEIPPNTGNVMRLCANTDRPLHLIEPLGFELDHTRLKRAGLDYREWARVRVHPSLEAFCASCRPARLFALTTRGKRYYTEPTYGADDAVMFGPETRGLPDSVLATLADEHWLRLPMGPNSRSLNLSNAVAVVNYEAWRQAGFNGAL